MIDPESIVKKFVPLIRNWKSRKDFFELQYKLIDSLSEVERALSQAKDRPHTLKINTDLVIEKAELSKELLLLFGDTLAWDLLNREIIRGSSINKKGGYITFRQGFEPEVLTLKEFEKKKDTFAILNDLTHCLGIGDVYALNSKGLTIVEVKSTSSDLPDSYDPNTDERLIKQIKRMEWLESYSSVKEGEISAGFHPDWEKIKEGYKPKSVHALRTASNSVDEYYHKELDKVIKKAKKNKTGFAYKTLEGIGTLHAQLSTTQAKPTTKMMDAAGIKKVDMIILGCLNRHIWEFHDFKPIPSFDISEESLIDILLQKINVCVVYPTRNIISALLKEGITANWEENGLSAYRSKHGHIVSVAPYQINRLLYEFLKPTSFAKIIVSGIDGIDSSPNH
jgi:hypothetical protein